MWLSNEWSEWSSCRATTSSSRWTRRSRCSRRRRSHWTRSWTTLKEKSIRCSTSSESRCLIELSHSISLDALLVWAPASHSERLKLNALWMCECRNRSVGRSASSCSSVGGDSSTVVRPLRPLCSLCRARQQQVLLTEGVGRVHHGASDRLHSSCSTLMGHLTRRTWGICEMKTTICNPLFYEAPIHICSLFLETIPLYLAHSKFSNSTTALC